jgi:lipid-binding SYLF domain-containing protein
VDSQFAKEEAKIMFRLAKAGLVSILLIALVTGCMSPKGDTVGEKRRAAQSMRSETLAQLYRVHPYAKTQIDQAAGYGVFSSVGMNLFLLSTASGWGIVRDRKTGHDTYMKMYSAGIGPGLGIKDFRGVFVFTSESALNQFVEDGWDASAQADAAAKVEDKGDAWGGSVDVAPGIKLYQLTQHGLALQATIQGTKFWKDDELS